MNSPLTTHVTSAPNAAGLPHGLPPLAWKLGHAGLLPFVLGALLVWLVNAEEAHVFVAIALSAYGAVIVSFLGGIHWGLVMRLPAEEAAGPEGRSALIWGITPSLVAWVGVCMPPHAGLFLLGLALIGCYLADRRRYPAMGLQHWLTLRFRLTAVASLCCFLGAAGS